MKTISYRRAPGSLGTPPAASRRLSFWPTIPHADRRVLSCRPLVCAPWRLTYGDLLVKRPAFQKVWLRPSFAQELPLHHPAQP